MTVFIKNYWFFYAYLEVTEFSQLDAQKLVA